MRKLVIALLVGLHCVAVSFSQQPVPSPPGAAATVKAGQSKAYTRGSRRRKNYNEPGPNRRRYY